MKRYCAHFCPNLVQAPIEDCLQLVLEYWVGPGWDFYFEQDTFWTVWTHKHAPFFFFFISSFMLRSSLGQGQWTCLEVTATTWRWELLQALCREAAGDILARTNWNHYSLFSLVPIKLWVCRNVVSYCIQACAPPNPSRTTLIWVRWSESCRS